MILNSEMQRLRVEMPINNSGLLFEKSKIPILKLENYRILPNLLDGDAPKEFIKAYIFERDSPVRKSNPKTWHKYIAKTAEKWYPHESVIEYMINKIGSVLGLNVNKVHLVQANGQIRFLSQYFLKENERLIHGAEICGEHLKDQIFAKEVANNKKSAREFFTFEFIEEALKCVYPDNYEALIEGLIDMIVFDAIIGNNDRHFYNWGVIDNKTDSNKIVRFAPIYDSARGLYWNMSDENIRYTLKVDNSGGRRIMNYVNEASPRISIESNVNANHFELLSFIINQRSQHKPKVIELTSSEMEKKVLRLLYDNFAKYFCVERNEIISKTLTNRFIQIRNLLI